MENKPWKQFAPKNNHYKFDPNNYGPLDWKPYEGEEIITNIPGEEKNQTSSSSKVEEDTNIVKQIKELF